LTKLTAKSLFINISKNP